MPSSRPKPSEIAVEAKRTYIPYVEQTCTAWPARSFAYTDVEHQCNYDGGSHNSGRPRVAVIDGDAVDIALKWNQEEKGMKPQDSKRGVPSEALRIPLVLPIDEKRAGGDWESGSMAPEENLSRRSNLVHCLSRSRTPSNDSIVYPVPAKGGFYAPNVVIFRSGAQGGYRVWSEFNWLPVVAVAPGRRPKLAGAGEDYSFDQERELMREKIRNVLRIAVDWGHHELCVGPFGVGPGFRNPAKQLAAMWKDVMFEEKEFQNAFINVVFAIENTPNSSGTAGPTDYEIFKAEFDPANVCKTSYRTS